MCCQHIPLETEPLVMLRVLSQLSQWRAGM